jgi:hypothetical protein
MSLIQEKVNQAVETLEQDTDLWLTSYATAVYASSGPADRTQ